MNKLKFLVMFLMALALLWMSGRVFAQAEETVQPQKSHDSTLIMKRRMKEIELSQQRKEAAKRFKAIRAKAAHDSASAADTTTNECVGGGQANE